ncbi:thioredoxin fold domain-containing protein [bacterium]|nr:thioredoxin fold domain-containing protein [bacterium]
MIKKTVFLIFFLFSTQVLSAEGEWLTGSGGYKALAQSNAKKGFLLYIYTDWCSFCKKFNREVLSDPQTQKFLAKIDKVKVNPEDGDAEDTIADDWHVDVLPTVLAIKNGKATPIPTKVTPEEFIKTVKNAL